MNIPEEFGNYLLLKKLTEDPLGETFRAGKAGREGMEQVVLLRVLNGKGMDGERLWQKVADRGAVQQALRSPNIGQGVDLGRVRSYPYTAYDYISGKNLATILTQSAKQGMPVPADHALLIAERMSVALANAYESRVGDERVLHGFLAPQLVMISNEGETRLLGFEIAPGLRELAATGWRDADLAPYLAPETSSPGAIGRADDVWSLGAILFELLTGERLPTPGPSGYGPTIDEAVTANDGAPIAAPIAALLKKSLVPRDQRIGDAVQWHKALSKLMIEGHYSPTTFNLAFFMHNLFRDEIEREGQEMMAEKKLAVTGISRTAAPAAGVATMAIPVAAAASAAGAAGAADLREKTGVREPTWPGTQAPHPPEPATAGSKKGLLAAVAAVVVVGLGVGGWFVFGRGTGTKIAQAPVPATQPTVPAAAVPATAQPTEAGAPAPSPEEIQKQIAAMFEARSKEMEAKLKGQYDDKIKGLQKQLEESKREERPSTIVPAVSTRPEPPPATVEPKAPAKPEPAPEKEAAATSVLPPPSAPPPSAPRSEPARPDPAKTEAPARPASAPAPAPREPAVKPGDLVQLGPGVVKPQVAGMPDPRYPAAARRMNKSAQVDLKVLVDDRGNVIQAEPAGARVGFGFDEAAVEAARRSTFRPATKDGVRVKMWTMLRVTFRP
ncbi:MAG TPA: TonB family protein [Thermoanaerobaculia bacterium]|jgi:TonB family protein|nr:TonB family protein [Thermoanaerobaculia bacterium]